ncbi:MAG: twin-arginine translocase TatA/TatE family subunit [Rubrobacteraceae bacterium]
MIPNVGITEALILLATLLLLFGAKRIPELAKGLGSGLREFRKGTSGEYDESHELEEPSESPSSNQEADETLFGQKV